MTAPATNGAGGEERRELTATVLNIQRMSSEDGPGLRTTVFIKGCSLECTWCHNPEAVCAKPQLVWHAERCIGSAHCVRPCPESAITLRQVAPTSSGAGPCSEVVIDHARCTACGECLLRCPSAALEMLGKDWKPEDLFDEVMKDEEYFAGDGGGVTVSGGEPGLRAPFVDAFLARCRTRGIHTAVDTCGMCSPHALRLIATQADLVLYDLKEIDPAKHRAFTGQSNERILANLEELGRMIRDKQVGCDLWIRTPLIPGATATEENVAAIGDYIARELGDLVERWELCSFNNLAADKYRRLGQEWAYETTALLSDSELRGFEAVARRSGVNPDIVVAGGPVRIDCDDETATVE